MKRKDGRCKRYYLCDEERHKICKALPIEFVPKVRREREKLRVFICTCGKRVVVAVGKNIRCWHCKKMWHATEDYATDGKINRPWVR